MDDQGFFQNNYLPSKRSPKTVSEWRESRRSQELEELDSEDESVGDAPPAIDGTTYEFKRKIDRFVAGIRKEVEANAILAKATVVEHATQDNKKKPSAFLFGVQEPHTHLKKLTMIRGATSIYDSNAKKIRAALVMSSTLNFWPCDDLMSGDLAVGQLLLNNGTTVYVASYYGDYNKPAINVKLRQLVNRANSEGKEVLIMGDMNSHSEALWNDKKTDARGLVWENFVANRSLKVHNIGDTFTFNTKKGQSIIDVTVSSANLEHLIKEWRVADAVPASDHCSIEFVLQVQGDTWLPRYNLAKADWEQLKEHMEQAPIEEDIHTPWNQTKFESEARRWISDLKVGLEKSCPETKARIGIKPIEWWDPESKRLHKRLTTIKNYLRRHNKYNSHCHARYTHDDLVDCRRAFKYACKKAKRRAYQDFTGEKIQSTVQVARMDKVHNAQIARHIGNMQNSSGQRCQPGETISLMAATHFPNCSPTPSTRVRTTLREVADLDDENLSYINSKRIKVVIDSFGPAKSPGPDMIPPKVYQMLGPKAIERLGRIYKASMSLGIMPQEWLNTRVVFLPKADKDSYDVPKSWRPITLMNFFMKILEKLNLWEFEDTVLINSPFQDEQYGFRKARSTESCLTNTYEKVELGIIQECYTVSVYCDIEGAYDQLQNDKMSEALTVRGAWRNYVHWYEDFFWHRIITINHKGVEITVYPTQGAPQGGVGSPMLFNLLADELIKQVKLVTGVNITMYADDACIFATGPDPKLCAAKVQQALDMAIAWGRDNALRFSPTKTKAMLITRKNKPQKPQKLNIDGFQLEYENEVKHLGLLVNKKLKWNTHLNWKVPQVKKCIMAHIKGTGKIWGYKPLLSTYVWRGIARPKLMYGSMIWYPALQKQDKINQIQKVQNLSFRVIAPYRQRTPIRGLQVLTYTPPIELYTQNLAIRSYLRTRSASNLSDDDMHTLVNSRVGHRQIIAREMEMLDLTWINCETDKIPPVRRWCRSFHVDLKSMSLENPKRGEPITKHRFRIYCDGSKVSEDLSGAGIVAYQQDYPLEDLAWHLGRNATVFQCEVFAVMKAAQWLLDHKQMLVDEMVSIFVDNQATLYALNNPIITSQLVLDTIDLLDEASRVTELKRIELHWVKAHVNHKGNERADANAKDGANNPSWTKGVIRPKLAQSVQHAAVHKAMLHTWTQRWIHDTSDSRQTRMWFPSGPVSSFSFSLLRTPRIVCGQLIQFLTGHNHLNRHVNLIAQKQRDNQAARAARRAAIGLESDSEEEPITVPDSGCDFCGVGKQTSEHILSQCDKFATLRLMHFGNAYPLPPFTMPLNKLIDFLREAQIKSLEMYETYEKYLQTNFPVPDSDVTSEDDN